MRIKLLVAVAVALCFNGTALARFGSNVQNSYDSAYQQGYDDAQDDATDWEDDNLPSPEHDSQDTIGAICGPYTLYMDGMSNSITVNGVTWKLVDGEEKSNGLGDTLVMTHYIKSVNTPDTVASIGVTVNTREFMLLMPNSPVYKCVRA